MSVRLGARLEADPAPFLQALADAETGLHQFEATAAAVADQVAGDLARLTAGPQTLETLGLLEPSLERAVSALQAVTVAGDDTARALTVLHESAADGGQALDHWSAAARQVGEAARTVDGSVVAASDAFTGLADDAGTVATAVGQLPLLFKVFIGMLALDVGVRVFGAVKDEIVALGTVLGTETMRLHRYIQEQEGLAGVVARTAEHIAVSRGTTLALTRLGVAAGVANPVGWAVSAVLTLDTLAERAGKAMAAADAAAAAHARLERELERTGHAAGLAGEDIEVLAQALARTTRFDSAGLSEAAQGLLRFRTISAEVFDEALRLSADLAAKTGRDLPEAVNLLGRALDAPAAGFQDLTEAGIHFSHAVREQIRDLEALGRHTEAQRLVMATVTASTREAASAMDDNARVAHRLEESWSRLAVVAGERLNTARDQLLALLDLGILPELSRWFDALAAEANEGWAHILSPEPVEQRIVAVNRALIAAQRDLAQAEQEAAEDVSAAWIGVDRVAIVRQQVTGLHAELDGLMAQARQAATTYDARLAGRQEQEALRHAERLAEVQKELERGTASLFPPGEADRIAAINAELDRTRALLESLRNADGSNAAQVEELAAGYERLAAARRQAVADEGQAKREQDIRGEIEAEGALIDKRHAGVAAIDEQIAALARERTALGQSARERAVAGAVRQAEETARQASITLSDAQRGALEREAAALIDAREAMETRTAAGQSAIDGNQRLIASLEEEIGLLHLSERDRAVEQAVRRLSADATAEQVGQVRELAGALFDEKQAVEENSRAEQALKRQREQDARAAQMLWERTRTGAERYADELRDLNALLEQGALDHETWSRAAEQAYDRMLDASTEWEDGLERGWRKWRAEATDGAAQAERLFTTATRGMEDVFVDFVKTGEISFEKLTDSILEDLARIAFQRGIMAPLGDLLFGGSGGGASGGLFSFFSGLFAQGAAFEAGAVVPFADGGVVSRPTLFPLAGGRAGLMGEAGPEAILPLRRTPDGRLGVAASGDDGTAGEGGGVVIHQIITIDARGADAGVDARIRAAMHAAKEQAKAEIAAGITRGGPWARLVGRR